MYIHIGGDYSLPLKLIVGIFDFETMVEREEQELCFLKSAESQNLIEYVSVDIPRSVVVTLDKIYLSPISARTLKQRCETGETNLLDDK